MRVNYGAVFQEKSKDRTMNGIVNIPSDNSLWPPEWKEIYYKIYDRFSIIDLLEPKPFAIDQSIYINRRSCRDFKPIPIDNQTLSNILYYAAGEIKLNGIKEKYVSGDIKRMQASAGGRYPIELYILNFIKGDLEKGVYHYNVRDHKLEYLWDIEIASKYMSNEWANDAAMAIVATAVPSRSVMKYGERAYKYIYLEAGAILQNIQIQAMINNIGSVINGGTNEIEIEELLDIDGVNETVILSTIIGHSKYKKTYENI